MTELVEMRRAGHVLWARPRPNVAGAAKSHSSPSIAFRAFDILLAGLAIFFLGPLLIVIAIAVRLGDGGPAMFGHERIGRGGRPFKCLKFRSMVPNAGAKLAEVLSTDAAAREEWDRTQKLRNDPRITAVGSFLRRSSLDELPQLFNVLRGDMSIVGPRPIVADEVRRYGGRFASYCRVRPGITGLWQVSGRNNTSFRTRVAMDAVYARNKSFLWDCQLIVATIPAVFLSRGAY